MKNLFIPKDRKSDSTVTKSGRYHVNEEIEVNTSSNGTNRYCMLSNRLHLIEHIYLCCSAENTWPGFNQEEISDKPKLKNIVRMTGTGLLTIFKGVKVLKVKRRPRNCSRVKKINKTWRLGAALDPVLPLCSKGCYWDKSEWSLWEKGI